MYEARFTAAIRLGMEEVPCIITHADAEAIKADRITDNKISEFSEWINEELLEEIDSIEFDLSELGLEKVNLDDVNMAEEAVGDISEEQREQIYQEFVKEQEQKKFSETPYYKLVCDKCGYVMFLKESDIE